MEYARSALVLHNMAYQGRGPFAELGHFEIPEEYKEAFFLDDPVGGEHMNVLKAAIIHSHRIVAVSHGYAWECQTQVQYPPAHQLIYFPTVVKFICVKPG